MSLFQLNECYDNWNRSDLRRVLVIPSEIKNRLREVLGLIKSENFEIYPHAANITVVRHIENFAERSATISAHLRKSIIDKDAEIISFQVEYALKTFEIGRSQDILTKPLLYYYSFLHLWTALLDAYLRWKKVSNNHGISYAESGMARLSGNGTFQKSAVTCFLFTRWPSIFDSPVYYVGMSDDIKSDYKLITQLSLQELCNFGEAEYAHSLKKVRIAYSLSKFNGLVSSTLLMDLYGLFMASNLVRYDISNWRRVLEDKNGSMKLYFMRLFARYETFTVDYMLSVKHPNF